MRISHNWLKELLPQLTLAPREIELKLTDLGLEVDGVRHHGETLESVLVARVEKIEPHPERDKLQLVTVSKGNGETQRVVCGASNVPSPGGLVVLAPLGTHLPAVGLTLSPRKIAGIVSEGMLCSETELGLAAQSDGIIVLDPGVAEPGQRFIEAFPEARDTVYELSITPNRPDALGHLGVARDLAALSKLELAAPPALTEVAKSASPRVQIENRSPTGCPRYGAAVVTGVRVGPSPSWVRWRLYRLGVRPISNVVDITNLLLLEQGQPMHAFDMDLLQGPQIVIRQARANEPFTTLDGVVRSLNTDDLVICDAERPVALAGIMGGENTEIRATTCRVLLECAYFTPSNIRRSARRHGLHTESSHRFERGVDWGHVTEVLARAKALLADLAGGRSEGDDVIVEGSELRVPSIRLRAARIDAVLGVAVPFDEAIDTLARLGFRLTEAPTTQAGQEALLTGASWRPDVTLEVDLIEEVARLRGYTSIPSVLPKISPQPLRTTGKLERATRRAATELGLSEAVTFSFVALKDLKLIAAPEPVVSLENPLTEERSAMRTSLLPGLLEVLRRARRRGEQQARLFTVGSIFLRPSHVAPSAEATLARPRTPEDSALPDERPLFTALIAGTRPVHLSKAEPLDIYDAKAVALGMVQRLSGKSPEVSLLDPQSEGAKHLHPRGAARLTVDGRTIGNFGPLHPDVVEGFDLGGGAFVVEIDLTEVERLGQVVAKYRAIPRLPAVSRDIALEVKRQIPAAEVQQIIREAGGELCENVELFDLFDGAPIKEGHRSLAFHVIYRDPNAVTNPDVARTLTDAEVDARHDEVVRLAKERLGATLRA